MFGVPGGRNHPPSYHYKYIPIYLLNKIRKKIIEWAENGPQVKIFKIKIKNEFNIFIRCRAIAP